jgi:hypothetical protein
MLPERTPVLVNCSFLQKYKTCPEAATLSCFGAYYQEDVLEILTERTIRTFATS